MTSHLQVAQRSLIPTLLWFLLSTAAAIAAPRTLRAEGRVSATQTEKTPAIASLTGVLFEVKAQVFVTDPKTVRIRLRVKNLAGSQAFYSVYGSVFDGSGWLLGGSGKNNVYHEKKLGEVYTEQWDVIVAPADLKRLQNFQIVVYEDTTFIGKR